MGAGVPKLSLRPAAVRGQRCCAAQSRAPFSPRLRAPSFLNDEPPLLECSSLYARAASFMGANAALERAPGAADARAAHPALSPSGAAPPSRPISPLSCSDGDEHDYDGEAGGAMEPLLPRYRFATAGETALVEGDKARRRRRRLQGIALLVSAPLVVFGIVVHLCASGTTRSASETFSMRENEVFSRPAPPFNDSTSLSLAQQFLHDPTSINKGVLPFDSTSFSPRYRPFALEHPLSTSSFAASSSCLAHYIATGDVCTTYDERWVNEASRPKLDVVWTWVNGSSAELMTRWRDAAQQEGSARSRVRRWASRAARAVKEPLRGAAVLRHFRCVHGPPRPSSPFRPRPAHSLTLVLSPCSEHDELRFSIRSVVQSLGASSLSTLHLVVGDTRASSPGADDLLNPDSSSRGPIRLAQLPHWLELSSIALSEPQLVAPSRAPQLLVHPHSELFKADPALDDSGASGWQQKALPSFNRCVRAR